METGEVLRFPLDPSGVSVWMPRLKCTESLGTQQAVLIGIACLPACRGSGASVHVVPTPPRHGGPERESRTRAEPSLAGGQPSPTVQEWVSKVKGRKQKAPCGMSLSLNRDGAAAEEWATKTSPATGAVS